jgi:hypothetical protein
MLDSMSAQRLLADTLPPPLLLLLQCVVSVSDRQGERGKGKWHPYCSNVQTFKTLTA